MIQELNHSIVYIKVAFLLSVLKYVDCFCYVNKSNSISGTSCDAAYERVICVKRYKVCVLYSNKRPSYSPAPKSGNGVLFLVRFVSLIMSLCVC